MLHVHHLSCKSEPLSTCRTGAQRLREKKNPDSMQWFCDGFPVDTLLALSDTLLLPAAPDSAICASWPYPNQTLSKPEHVSFFLLLLFFLLMKVNNTGNSNSYYLEDWFSIGHSKKNHFYKGQIQEQVIVNGPGNVRHTKNEIIIIIITILEVNEDLKAQAWKQAWRPGAAYTITDQEW